MGEWENGRMAEWQNGRMAKANKVNYALKGKLVSVKYTNGKKICGILDFHPHGNEDIIIRYFGKIIAEIGSRGQYDENIVSVTEVRSCDTSNGGKYKRKVKNSKPVKTERKYKCKDGVLRRLYEKDNIFYVKMKNKLDKFIFKKIKT